MNKYGEPVSIGDGPVKFKVQYQDLLKDQGLTISVLGEFDNGGRASTSPNAPIPFLNFYCFDHDPHYYYGDEKQSERISIDQTTEGEPLEWILSLFRNRLPELVARAGFQKFAKEIKMASLGSTLDELENTARKMATEQRSTVIHNRGDVIIEAGPIRFGIEDREPGIAIHILGDIDGEEKEMLTFDCFDEEPHYHYGPRAKNQRLYLDTTAIPDSLQWALDLLKGGKLVPMLQRAGYYDHASRLNPTTIANKLPELESVALAMKDARTL